MSIVFADLDGPRISQSLDFGNAAGPAICHRPMAIFIQIIHHRLGLRIAELRQWSADQWSASGWDSETILADLTTLDAWSAIAGTWKWGHRSSRMLVGPFSLLWVRNGHLPLWNPGW